MPDGGYQIFVTLNKESLAPDHDYEDILLQDRLVGSRVEAWIKTTLTTSRCAIRRRECLCSCGARIRSRSSIWGRGVQAAPNNSPMRDVPSSVQSDSSVSVPDPLFAESTAGTAESRGSGGGPSRTSPRGPFASGRGAAGRISACVSYLSATERQVLDHTTDASSSPF